MSHTWMLADTRVRHYMVRARLSKCLTSKVRRHLECDSNVSYHLVRDVSTARWELKVTLLLFSVDLHSWLCESIEHIDIPAF